MADFFRQNMRILLLPNNDRSQKGLNFLCVLIKYVNKFMKHVNISGERPRAVNQGISKH